MDPVLQSQQIPSNSQPSEMPSIQQIIFMAILLPVTLVYFSKNKVYQPFLAYIYLISGSLYILVLLIFRFNFYARLQGLVAELGLRKTSVAENLFPVAVIFALTELIIGFLIWRYVKKGKILPGFLPYAGVVVWVLSVLTLGFIVLDSLSTLQLLLPQKSLIYTFFTLFR